MNKVGSHYLLFALLSAMVLCVSCSQDEFESMEVEKSRKPFFTRFSVMQDANPILSADYDAEITNDSIITLFCPEFQMSDSIVPSFEGNFVSVEVAGVRQVSGQSVQDFNEVVRYELTDSVGNRAFYDVVIKVLNKVPRVDIVTEGGVGVTSKTEYVPATIKISNCPEFGEIDAACKIRGRGNATWNYPKKPYKIKFTEKQSPFGFPANKDWVLLAEANDRALLRTAYMCEVSKALGIEYTINYQYVDLFLNHQYLGTYLLTDQVEEAKNRVQVEDDGFLIEQDNYYSQEPLYFVTDKLKFGYSFKYPDADDGDIVKDDDNYQFIVSFMNDVERTLLLLNDNRDNVEYMELIDIVSFAKYYLAMDIMANRDPNRYYVLSSRQSKLKMMPVWDAEWSLGVWPVSAWGNPPASMVEWELWKTRFYFLYLFKSPVFIEAVRKEWADFQDKIPLIKEAINEICEEIVWTQKANFERWPGSGGQTLNVTFDTWEEEVDYTNTFFDMRLEWLNGYLSDGI